MIAPPEPRCVKRAASRSNDGRSGVATQICAAPPATPAPRRGRSPAASTCAPHRRRSVRRPRRGRPKSAALRPYQVGRATPPARLRSGGRGDERARQVALPVSRHASGTASTAMVTSIPPEATRSAARTSETCSSGLARIRSGRRHDRLCDLGELAVGPEAVEERERLRRHAEARRGRLVGELLRPGEEGIVAAVTGVSVRSRVK